MKSIALLCALMLSVNGCALFIKPSTEFSVERQKFINAYARARVTYQHLHARIDALCQVDRLTKDICAKAAAIDHQAKALDAEIQAKLTTPESEVDWDRVMRLLELALGLVL